MIFFLQETLSASLFLFISFYLTVPVTLVLYSPFHKDWGRLFQRLGAAKEKDFSAAEARDLWLFCLYLFMCCVVINLYLVKEDSARFGLEFYKLLNG